MVLVVAQIRTVRQCWIEKRDDARMVHRDLNSQLCETLKRGGSHFHETLKRGGSHDDLGLSMRTSKEKKP